MTKKILFAALLWAHLLCFASAQQLFKSDLLQDDAIERGEQLILDSGNQRELMPNRWAALIQYEVNSTPDAEFYMTIHGTAYTAVDKELGIIVLRRKQSDQQPDENGQLGDWPTSSFDWQSKNEKIMQSDNNHNIWIPTKPGLQRPHFDPFVLWLSASDCLEKGASGEVFLLAFYGVGRTCITSVKRKDGNIESVWSHSKPRKGIVVPLSVLHDAKFGMPIEFESTLCTNWDPKKPFERGKTLQRLSTRWENIAEYRVNVPVEVHSNWMANDESLEAKFTIKWLFENNVPDDAFIDPRKGKIKIPSFSTKKNTPNPN